MKSLFVLLIIITNANVTFVAAGYDDTDAG